MTGRHSVTWRAAYKFDTKYYSIRTGMGFRPYCRRVFFWGKKWYVRYQKMHSAGTTDYQMSSAICRLRSRGRSRRLPGRKRNTANISLNRWAFACGRTAEKPTRLSVKENPIKPVQVHEKHHKYISSETGGAYNH